LIDIPEKNLKRNQIGKVLWWSSRDANGIIVDPQGNEYYFDRSILGPIQQKKISKGLYLTFSPERIDGLRVAKRISLPKSSSIPKYSEQFNQESTQLHLAV
jgi:hypothetical protein